jgi:hypothetical protein
MHRFSLARVLGAALFVGIFSLGGCSPFHFDDQDIDLLLDREGDRLELRIQYDHIRSKGDSASSYTRSSDNLKRILAKERLLVLYDLPLDLDQQRDDEAPPNEEERLLMEEVKSVLAGITVLDAGATLDDEGRPSVWQRIEVQDVQRMLALLNRAMNYTITSDFSATPDEVYDEQTLRAWTEKAEEGGKWILIDERGLVLRAPVSPQAMARILVQSTDPNGDEAGLAFLFDFLSPLSEFRMVDGSAELVFAVDEAGVIHWNLRREDLGLNAPIDTKIVESNWFQAALPGK